MDAVQTYARSVGGTLEGAQPAGSWAGRHPGAAVALAQLEVLLLRRGPDVYGIPVTAVDEVVRVTRNPGGSALEVDGGHPVPVADMAAVLGANAPPLAAAAGLVSPLWRPRRVVVRPGDRGGGGRGQAAGPARPGGRLPGRDHSRDGRVALLIEPGLFTRRKAAREGRPPADQRPPRTATPAPASSRRSSSSRTPSPCGNCSAASWRRPGIRS